MHVPKSCQEPYVPLQEVVAGVEHTCVLMTDLSTVKCFGGNDQGAAWNAKCQKYCQ